MARNPWHKIRQRLELYGGELLLLADACANSKTVH